LPGPSGTWTRAREGREARRGAQVRRQQLLHGAAVPRHAAVRVQIRIACDQAKAAAANLSGKEAPKHEDTETTMVELRARIAKCLAFLDTFTADDFEQRQARHDDSPPNRPGKAIAAEEYLYARQMPNFFFHVTTAYDLLRHGGVEIGKSDYLGPLGFRRRVTSGRRSLRSG
jgi:hypothetical protein